MNRCFRTDLGGDDESKEEVSVTDVDGVLSVIRSDYEKAYFVTGIIPRFFLWICNMTDTVTRMFKL